MTMQPQRAAAAAFLVLSGAYLALALRLEDVATVSTAAIGPRVFPLLVGALGVLISLLLLAAAPTAAQREAIDPAPATSYRSSFAGDWRRALALCGLTLLYAAALPVLGFTLATTGFLAASFALLGERRRVALALVPLAIALASIVLLRGALGAYLPEPLFEIAISRLRD